MNQAPKFLHLSKTQTIPGSVFDDLQLRRLLSDKTITVLSHPAVSRDNIRDIQAFFAYMLTDDGKKTVKDLYLALKEYDRVLRQWKASPAAAEKAFLFHQLLQNLLTVSEMFAALTEGGNRSAEIAACFREKAPFFKTMEETLAQGKQLLDRISSFDISIMETMYMTEDTIPVTYLDTVLEAAKAFGIETEPPKQGKIRLNDGLSHALTELYAAEFAQLETLYAPYADISFGTLSLYIGELDFFYEIIGLLERAAEIGVSYCFPSCSEKRICSMQKVYDISLLIKDAKDIIPNDTFFDEKTPFFFLTGANGGGKTTYLRAVGISLLLFLSGCPVFAEHADIYPYRKVLSHFPADERFSSFGRLDEEKARVGEMLAETDADTFLVFNETFSGTDDEQGCALTLRTAETIREKGASGLFVTHFHEVRAGGWPMLNTIVTEDDSHRRTFRIVRDLGLTSSFAEDILKKYRLDAASLAERSVSHEV